MLFMFLFLVCHLYSFSNGCYTAIMLYTSGHRYGVSHSELQDQKIHQLEEKEGMQDFGTVDPIMNKVLMDSKQVTCST